MTDLTQTKTTTTAPLPRARRFGRVRRVGSRATELVGGAISKRRSFDGVIIGCLLTLLVISFDAAGWLIGLELPLFDLRAQTFQTFLPRPTDKLVHLDLDDGALEAVEASDGQNYPWRRSVWADIIDELALAKPKVVGLDVLFAEASKADWQPAADAKRVSDTVVEGRSTLIDHDRLLGDALARLGCALIPVSLEFDRSGRPSDLYLAMRTELRRDLSQSQAQLVERLRARGITTADLPDQVGVYYLSAWSAEASVAIRRELQVAPVPLEVVKRNVLKLETPDLVLLGKFDELYQEALSLVRVNRFSRPIPPVMPALFNAQLKHLPVPPVAAAAAFMGNVEYPPFRDGVVRAVPLFVKNEDRMYPQMGLAMACAQLGVDVSNLKFAERSVTLPTADGREVVVHHRPYRSTQLGEEIATFMDIPWWGGRQWAYMYDVPAHAVPVNHLSIVAVWDLVLTRRKLAVNTGSADAALIAVMAVSDDAAAQRYAGAPPPPEDLAARRAAYAEARKGAAETAELVQSLKPEELDEQSRRFLAAYSSLPSLMGEIDALEQRLTTGRAEMLKRVNGKSVLIGWTATGAAADFVPTSVHAKCPGVVIHGAIYNAIMTGEIWRTLPNWVTYLVTGVLGLGMTAAAAFMTPARALVVAFCLMVGYVLLNGMLLFDYGNVIIGAAGPLLCIAGVWQGVTLIRLIVERYQRSRIEGRFRSYVDPALVDYVVENPDQAKLEGQIREMTVCFTDLGNFTPLTVKLKEATVPLLNRIFSAMVPEIRKNNGYVNKFLGDGVMFFFGAPRENPDHAQDALRTILDVQDAMKQINAELAARGLSAITLRAGVNTGNMVVGDAGSEKASDYTVLGDDVNLAARMESANKQLGTTLLVSARTVELAGEDGVLLRPVGQICVVGRSAAVVAYEILCRQADATDQQRRLAELSRYMVDAFRDARLDACLRAADDLDREFGGPSKLTNLYRARCEHFLAQPSLDGFSCVITLAEK